jgi:hypothetical protein
MIYYNINNKNIDEIRNASAVNTTEDAVSGETRYGSE